jgi:REP element-mobilizing transposase RayT
MEMTNAALMVNLPRMGKAIQQDLFDGKREHGPRRYKHGGDINVGKRKLARPFKKNAAIHIVFKSSLAKGVNSMLSPRNRLAIDRIIEKQARKQEAKVHGQQNVGNHIHFMASFKTKKQLTRFLKAVAGLIARHVLGAQKGQPAGTKFWDHPPFSRIIQGARDFAGMVRYILKNEVEARLGKAFREGIEKFDRAQAKAQKTGRAIWEFL